MRPPNLRKIFTVVFLILLVYSAKAQQPSGFPITNSTGWIKYGYLQNDSGRIDANRDTNWTPRFIPTTVFWKHVGVDTAFWTYVSTTGQKWMKQSGGSGGGSGNSWSLIGNAGTNVATNFIGTTDSVHSLNGRLWNHPAFYVAQPVMKLSSSPQNRPDWGGQSITTLGYGAGEALINLEHAGHLTDIVGASTGSSNILIGLYAGTHIGDKLDPDSTNWGVQSTTIIGTLAGMNMQYGQGGDYGRATAIGANAMFTTIEAGNSTAVGAFSQERQSKGLGNTSVGAHSLRTIVNGSFNTAIGVASGYFSTGIIGSVSIGSVGSGYTTATVIIDSPRLYGQPNMTAIGETPATAHAVIVGGQITSIVIDNPGAGYSDTYSTTFTHGMNNPPQVHITGDGVGANATATVINSNANSYLGFGSNWMYRAGWGNIGIGYFSGNGVMRFKDTTTILLGTNSQVASYVPSTTNLTNATAIGAYTKIAQSNTVILGDSAQGTQVGIGTSLPTAQLHTTGSVRFAGLPTTGTYYKTVRSDASGNLFLTDTSAASGGGINIYNTDGILTGNRKLDATTYNLWLKTPFKAGEDSIATNHVFIGDTNRIPHYTGTAWDGQNNASLVISKTKSNNGENVDLFAMTTGDIASKNGWDFQNYSNSVGVVLPRLLTWGLDGVNGYIHQPYVKTNINEAYLIDVMNIDSANVGIETGINNTSSSLFTVSNNSSRKLDVFSNGKMKFGNYGLGTFTGTPAYNLVVDASGNVIETTAGISTPTLQQVTTAGNTTTNDINRTVGTDTIRINSDHGVNQMLFIHGADTVINFNSSAGNFVADGMVAANFLRLQDQPNHLKTAEIRSDSLTSGGSVKAFQLPDSSGVPVMFINGAKPDKKGQITVGGGLTIGTTAITSGADKRILYQNGTTVGQTSGFEYDNVNKALSTPLINIRKNGGTGTSTEFYNNTTTTGQTAGLQFKTDNGAGGASGDITFLSGSQGFTMTPNGGVSTKLDFTYGTSHGYFEQGGSHTDLYGGTGLDLRLGANASATTGIIISTAGNVTMSGSLGLTGTRVTKGWFTDGEFTNMPTVGGTSLSSTFSPIAGSSSITTLGTITSGTIGTGAVIARPTMTLGSDATGDIYYRNSGGILTRLPIGTTTQTLHVVGGLPAWVDTSTGGGMTNPMTTIGDIIYGGASGTPTRLAAGTANWVLQSNGAGAAPSWAAGGNALTSNPLSQFATTTSAQFFSVVTDGVGTTGKVVGTTAFVFNETPTGTVNGVNTSFTIANTPLTGSVKVFVNGLRKKLTTDYSVSGTTITFVDIPATGSDIIIDYMK